MNLLSFDLSTPTASAALYVSGPTPKITQWLGQDTKQPSRDVLIQIEKLLQEANLSLKDINAIILGRGPGSFTGLRIAAGLAQGLALSNNIPIIPVSSLQAIAQNAYKAEQIKPSRIYTAQDAQVSAFYCAVFNVSTNGILTLDKQERLCKPHEIYKLLKYTCYAGNGWHYCQELFNKHELTWTPHIPTAQALLNIVIHDWDSWIQKAVSPEEALPEYLLEPMFQKTF